MRQNAAATTGERTFFAAAESKLPKEMVAFDRARQPPPQFLRKWIIYKEKRIIEAEMT